MPEVIESKLALTLNDSFNGPRLGDGVLVCFHVYPFQ